MQFQSEVVYMATKTSNVDTATPPDKTDDNTIFVGMEGVMDYIAIITPLNKGATDIKTGANDALGKPGRHDHNIAS